MKSIRQDQPFVAHDSITWAMMKLMNGSHMINLDSMMMRSNLEKVRNTTI